MIHLQERPRGGAVAEISEAQLAKPRVNPRQHRHGEVVTEVLDALVVALGPMRLLVNRPDKIEDLNARHLCTGLVHGRAPAAAEARHESAAQDAERLEERRQLLRAAQHARQCARSSHGVGR